VKDDLAASAGGRTSDYVRIPRNLMRHRFYRCVLGIGDRELGGFRTHQSTTVVRNVMEATDLVHRFCFFT
jgi:hypothetical protein